MSAWMVMKRVLFSFILVFGIVPFRVGASPEVSKELVQYVRDARKAGLNDTQIQQNAAKAGWPASDVSEAIASVSAAGKQNDEEKKSDNAPAVSATATVPNTGQPAPAATEPNTGQPAPAAAAPNSPEPAKTAAPAEAAGGTPAVKTEAKSDRGVPDDYVIGAGDMLHVSVWHEAEASIPSVVVRPDGKISMPMIKEVRVVGLTPSQVEKNIAEQLSKFISGADVTVVVTQINSKKIYFVGAVKREGPMNYSYRMTVLQALSEAGGLTDYAKKKRIYVLHQEDGREFKLPFDYNAVLRGEHMEQNITLMPGDTIIVPK